MDLEYLLTERLAFRKVDPITLKFIHSTYSDYQMMEFYGTQDQDQIAREIEKFNFGLNTVNKYYLYFHLLKGTSSEVIGWCGYHTWHLEQNRAEIGYGSFTDKDNRTGLISEAMNAILKYGFEKMNLQRIEAFILPDNLPSFKLIEKFGFNKEGILREHYMRDGDYDDPIVFGLIKAKSHKKLMEVILNA